LANRVLGTGKAAHRPLGFAKVSVYTEQGTATFGKRANCAGVGFGQDFDFNMANDGS